MIDLAELLTLIAHRWPDRYQRGRILHVHQNAVHTSAGLCHLRVMVQRVGDETQADDNHQEVFSDASYILTGRRR